MAASPQLEDGFTSLANELLEATTRFNFSRRQYKILLYVWRNTYGVMRRKEMPLDYNHMAGATHIAWNHCTAVLTKLAVANAVTILLPSRESPFRRVAIQKDYSLWRATPKLGVTPKPGVNNSQVGNLSTYKESNNIERSPLTPLKGGKETDPPKKKSRTPKKLTALPVPFEISESMRDWFRRTFGDVPTPIVRMEHEGFCSYWLGIGKMRKDWEHTWRNSLIRNSQDRKLAFGRFIEDRKRGAVRPTREYLSDHGPFDSKT